MTCRTSQTADNVPPLERQPDGFTLIELVVAIAVLGVLTAIALPALAANRGKSKAMQCLGNVRAINLGTTLFTEENGFYPPLYRLANATGWPAWTYGTNFVVQNSAALFWPDALRLEGYVKDPDVFSCPAVIYPASHSAGGGSSTNSPLGIGMNYPNIGVTISSSFSVSPRKPAAVKNPGKTVVFGDSGAVTTASRDSDPDLWVPDTGYDAALGSYYGGGSIFFRSPNDASGFASGDARMIPRHDRRVVTGWADGHVELFVNSRIGWNYPVGNTNALWDLK